VIPENVLAPSACVVHVGCFKDREKAKQAVTESLNRIKYPDGSKLLLEVSSGEGNDLGESIDEIIEILTNTRQDIHKHLGICLDTCHLFASGQYDLRTIQDIDKLISDVHKSPFPIGLIHLNDSKGPFESRKDRHADIACGHIWGQDQECLRYLLSWMKKQSIPSVVETHSPEDPMILQKIWRQEPVNRKKCLFEPDYETETIPKDEQKKKSSPPISDKKSLKNSQDFLSKWLNKK
jgi:endonuclease IV